MRNRSASSLFPLHILAQVQGEVNKLIPGVEEHIGRLSAVIQAALDEAVEAGRIEGAPITRTNLERTIMKVLEASGIQDVPQLLCQGTRALPSTGEPHARQRTLSDLGRVGPHRPYAIEGTLVPLFGRMSPWSSCSTTSCFANEWGMNLPHYGRSFTWSACSALYPRVSCVFVPR